MDFYKRIKQINTWNNLLEFLKIMRLTIIKYDISLINRIKKFLGLTYEISIIVSNSIVTYKIDLIMTESSTEKFLNIKNITIL